MAKAYIGLGSNLGDRSEALCAAVQRLRTLGHIMVVSSLYQTEPVGFLEQPPFLNAVVAIDTALPPVDLLHALLDIERELGRTRTFQNAPRTLDLDLLFVGDLIVDSAELALPHPRLHERAFVLVPLAEIAPQLKHPILMRSVAELKSSVSDEGVKVYAAPGWESMKTG